MKLPGLYRVYLRCDAVPVRLDGEDRVLGFFKNEFTLARNASSAVAVASARVRRELVSQMILDHETASNATLHVEAVERSASLVRVLFRQGFIFFDPTVEGDDMADDLDDPGAKL